MSTYQKLLIDECNDKMKLVVNAENNLFKQQITSMEDRS